MSEKKIRGCPFCGEAVKVWGTEFGVVNIVECKMCGVKFIFSWDKTGTELFKAWNKRARKKFKVRRRVTKNV